MSSPFSFRPSTIAAGFEILPKDSYTFEIGEPKTFSWISKDPTKNGASTFGVMYPLKVVSEGEKKGKSINYQLWLHSDGGQKVAKQFLMAAAGFDIKHEGDYNAKYDSADWSTDFNSKSCGSAWHELSGKLIKCDLDVGMNKDTNQEQQNFGFWQIYG